MTSQPRQPRVGHDMNGVLIPQAPTVRDVVELLGHTYRPEGVVIALQGRKRSLGERAPIDLLDTPEGRKEAYDWALSLAEGAFS